MPDLGSNCTEALYLIRNHLKGCEAISTVDSKRNIFLLSLGCHTLSSLVPKTVEPPRMNSESFSGDPESQAEHQDEQLLIPQLPAPLPTPAEDVSWVSCVTNQRLALWTTLGARELSPQHPEEEVVLVSRTKKKTFFFLFHSLKKSGS